MQHPRNGRKKKKGKSGFPPTPAEHGATPSAVNPRAGSRERCCGCGSEFHLLPNCPGKQRKDARRAPIEMELPKEDGQDTSGGEVYTTSFNLGSKHRAAVRRSMLVRDAGAAASLVGSHWLNNHNDALRASGRPLAQIVPAFASFRYGDGHVGEVHRAALLPIAIAGYTGRIMAYVADSDIPDLVGKEALDTLGGQLNFCERALTLGSLGVDIPLEMSNVGHYLLQVDAFPESDRTGMMAPRTKNCGRRAARNMGAVRKEILFFMEVTPKSTMHPAGKTGPPLTLSCFELKQVACVRLRPGGRILPSLSWIARHRFPPQASPTNLLNCGLARPIHNIHASAAAGEALDGEKSDPKEIVRRLHANWGHASAQQLKRAIAEAEGQAGELGPLVDGVVKECDICRAFDVTPAIPVAGTSVVSLFQ